MADNTPERTYIGLRDLKDAGMLARKRTDGESARTILKREWALNREFYNGNQWSIWNPEMLRVESLAVDKLPKWRVRLQSNQIKPGLASLVAQLTKTRPTITAEPTSGGDTDVKAAQMATSLFESLFEDLKLNSRLQDVMHEAGLSGGYWKITWDALAGKPMTFTMGPDGQPIMDDELAEVFIDHLAQQLLQDGHAQSPDQAEELAEQVGKKTIYVGDIKVETMMAENVLLDPSASDFEDAKWAICKHSLDPDEIYARWGKQVDPSASKTGTAPIVMGASVQEKKPVTQLREVYIMYIRPCPALQKGRYVVWIEGPDQILQDMDWPYPFTVLPLVKFPGVYRPDSPYDDPIVTDIRPLQKELNKILSQIVEHRNLVLRPQLLAVVGSLKTKMTSEPGAVIEYAPTGTLPPPTWREMPQIPQSLFEQLQDIQARIDRGFNRIPSSRDQIPARADGGALLEGMQEATADQISTMITDLEDALALAGHLMISLAQKYYEEPRLMRIRGVGGSVQAKKFEAADIQGGFNFKPRYGTGLPRTRQGKQDAIMQLVEMKLIDPGTALKHLDLADVKGVQNQIAADEDQALREHDKMLRGQPVNPAALQDAQQQSMQFQQQSQQTLQQIAAGQPVDIDGDGQADDPMHVLQSLQQQGQQIGQALQDAPWQPLDFENWEAHIQTHGDYMKTVEYENLDPQVAALFLKHYNLTYQRWMQIRMSMPDPNNTPKINVRAMGTVSAPVMTALLAKSGVHVEQSDVEQPALDTVVVDNLNAPKVNPSGDDPLTQADQMLSMQQGQDKHDVAQAQAVQGMGLETLQAQHAQTMHEQQVAQQQQQMQHAQEMHEAKLEAQKALAARAAQPQQPAGQ